MCLYGGGFDCKIGKQEGLFGKNGGGSLLNRGKGRGLRAKQPLIPFLSTGK